MSSNGWPCTSPRVMRLNDTSTRPTRRHDIGDVGCDGRLVKHIERRQVRFAAGFGDVVSGRFQRRAGTADQKQPGALTGEGGGHAPADAAAGAVDDRVLVAQ